MTPGANRQRGPFVYPPFLPGSAPAKLPASAHKRAILWLLGRLDQSRNRKGNGIPDGCEAKLENLQPCPGNSSASAAARAVGKSASARTYTPNPTNNRPQQPSASLTGMGVLVGATNMHLHWRVAPTLPNLWCAWKENGTLKNSAHCTHSSRGAGCSHGACAGP